MGATGLLEAFMGVPNTPKNREKFIATIPLGRLSERQDIANASLYLASDEVVHYWSGARGRRRPHHLTSDP